MDRRLKNKSIHDRLGKRVVSQDWTDREEGSNQRKHVWQEGQWCPGGLTRSQKRRVQRLRNKELEQAQASGKTQVWRTKQIADRKQPSTNIQMAFLLRQNSELRQIRKFIQTLMNQSMKRWLSS